MIALHHADCLEHMRKMEPGSVDAIITDLPYGTTACKWDTVIPFDPMWEAVKHVLKPNGAFVTTASQPFTSLLVCSNLAWFKYDMLWDKGNTSGFLNASKKCNIIARMTGCKNSVGCVEFAKLQIFSILFCNSFALGGM